MDLLHQGALLAPSLHLWVLRSPARSLPPPGTTSTPPLDTHCLSILDSSKKLELKSRTLISTPVELASVQMTFYTLNIWNHLSRADPRIRREEGSV